MSVVNVSDGLELRLDCRIDSIHLEIHLIVGNLVCIRLMAEVLEATNRRKPD